MIKNVIEKKGTWSFEEDQKLRQWVAKHGAKRWAFCKDIIPGRTGKQCRERWQNNLDPDVKKGKWSQEEDNIIFDAYKTYGSCWSKIAQLLKGRTENHIKNRFYSTVRKLIKEQKKMNKDIGLEQQNEDVVVEIRKYDSKKQCLANYQRENKLFSLLSENDSIIKKKNCMKNYFLEYKKQELNMGDQVQKVKKEAGVLENGILYSNDSMSNKQHENIPSYLTPNEFKLEKRISISKTKKKLPEESIPQQITQEIREDTTINYYLQELQKLQTQLQQTNNQLGSLDNKILQRRDNLNIQNFGLNNLTSQNNQERNSFNGLLQLQNPQQSQNNHAMNQLFNINGYLNEGKIKN